MRPLAFLTVRSFLNGIKRAFTSPQRLIGMLFILGYWAFQFSMRLAGPRRHYSGTGMGLSTLNPATIETWVFVGFTLLSLILMLGSLSPRGGFRPADVDVLFATPVNPKLVLMFRVFRDYLITLLMSLILVLISFGGPYRSVGNALRMVPDRGALFGRSIVLSWLLLSLAWVCVGYGLSMFVNRSDPRSDTNSKLINWSVLAILLGTACYVGIRFRAHPAIDTVTELTHSQALRTIFFTATAATDLAVAPLQGSWTSAITGIVGLLGVAIFGIALAITQVGWMYDQAAAKGFGAANMRKLQRAGDTYGMMAEQARRGKIKSGRLAGLIRRWNPRGASTLVWKELLLQARGALWQYLVFGPLIAIIVLGPLWIAGQHESSTKADPLLLLVMEALGVLMMTIQNAQGGFIEVLRRVDVQKPLPFTPTAIVFWEVLAKIVPTSIVTSLTAIAALAIDPAIWSTAFASLLMAPALALALSSMVLVVTLIFPDVEDAAQRSFRGLMVMLGCAMAALPGVLVYGLLTFLGLHILVVAPFVAGAYVGVTAVVVAICGGLYASFNPSD